MPVVGKTIFQGKKVQPSMRDFEHLLSSIEQSQSLDVLMKGHAFTLLENAA